MNTLEAVPFNIIREMRELADDANTSVGGRVRYLEWVRELEEWLAAGEPAQTEINRLKLALESARSAFAAMGRSSHVCRACLLPYTPAYDNENCPACGSNGRDENGELLPDRRGDLT